MKSSHAFSLILALGAAAAAPLASAIEPIPQTPGWRGFVVGGAGYTDVKSNLVAGNGVIDIGRETINSIYDAPQSDSTWHPVFTGEINYTFEDQWQVFLGTSLEDARDAGRRVPVRGPQGPWRARDRAGRVSLQRHTDPDLGGSVCGRRQAQGDRSRLQRLAPTVGPVPGFCIRTDVLLARHFHRKGTQRAGRNERLLRCCLPGPAAAGRRPVLPSTSRTFSSWGRVRDTCCARWFATRSKIARAMRSAATHTVCS